MRNPGLRIYAFITISLLTVVLFACHSSSKPQSIKLDFHKVMEGSKANRYKITMDLISTKGSINGKYYYNNQGIDVPLKGWIRQNGNFHIIEYNTRGQAAGIFEGQFLEGKKLEGQWRKPEAVQTLAFFAQESQQDYDANKKKLKIPGLDDMELATFTGIYVSVESGRMGSLTLQYAGDGKLSFTITSGAPAGCRATLEGTAIFRDNTHAKFKSSGTEDADLEFIFNEKKLTVKEKKGGNYHGSDCAFGGDYLWKERE